MFLSRREQGRGLLPLSGLYADSVLFFAVKRVEEIARSSGHEEIVKMSGPDKAAGRAGPEDVVAEEKIA